MGISDAIFFKRHTISQQFFHHLFIYVNWRPRNSFKTFVQFKNILIIYLLWTLQKFYFFFVLIKLGELLTISNHINKF